MDAGSAARQNFDRQSWARLICESAYTARPSHADSSAAQLLTALSAGRANSSLKE